jgi:HAD superfamily hydrolase (TIGR01459 family)
MLEDVGLADTPLVDATAILLTGLRDDRVETPADYAGEIADWKARGLPVLCANPDIQVDRGEARLWCAGAIAQDYEHAGGELVWFGKPHGPIYQRAMTVLGEVSQKPIPQSRVLAIGDGIKTDVPGGLAAGFDTLFVTGGLSAEELGADVENPDPALLDTYLRSVDLAPQFAIGRLR